MMSIGMNRINPLCFVGHRLLSAKTAHQSDHSTHGLKPESVKTKTLPNGLKIVSQENYSPLSRIAVCIKAGSRYEPDDQLGLVHALRNAAGLSTKRSTIFGITRNIEFVGGRLYAVTTRDLIIYVLENIRDHTFKNIDYLSDTILEPAFKPWELTDFAYRQKIDLALLNETPQLRLTEALHKAAFRGGLSKSLFSPEFNVGKITNESLTKYVNDHFVANRTAIVGLGIDHERLVDLVGKKFALPTGDRGSSGESKYVGGEIRVDTNSDITHVAVAAEGASIKNQKEFLALTLFQVLLGTGPRIKYSLGNSSILGQAAGKVAENPFTVSSLNISHSDHGLFGFIVASSANEVHKIVKAVVSQLRDSAKKVSEQDLKNAKNILKANILLSLEDTQNFVEELGTQAVLTGQALTGNDIEKAIDSLTLQDVSSIASKIIKGKGTMASVGKLHNTPYLEDLA